MEHSAVERGIQYARVGMFRSDVLYVTPIDIYQTDRQTHVWDNQQAILAPFGQHPVNDRMIYGPAQAVRVWATQRFRLLEDYVHRSEPGWAMHSEKFMQGAILPAMGVSLVINPDICFLRTRADTSVVLNDCEMFGQTRGVERINMKRVVENIIERTCSEPYRVKRFRSIKCVPP